MKWGTVAKWLVQYAPALIEAVLRVKAEHDAQKDAPKG